MKCSIYKVLDAIDYTSGTAILYTNLKGLKRLKGGDSFYVWTESYAKDKDIKLKVFQKDLSVDDQGKAYCVDGLDVIIL